MRRRSRASLIAAAALLAAPLSALFVHPARAQPGATESQRLTAFLDAEFAAYMRDHPELATQMGDRQGYDRLDDISEAARLKEVQGLRASVARMRARFQRDRLPPEARISYDMWALEADHLELAWKFRRHDLVFGDNAPHSSLPSFLISSHLVDTTADMVAYTARLAALGRAMDQARARAIAAASDGIRMPRFQYERTIDESKRLISGAPFDSGPDSALWADAKAKVAGLQATGKATPAQAARLLAGARAALLNGMRPGYRRLIAWAERDMAAAPSGKVGALTLPDGAAWYAAALKLQTTTDLTAEQIHALGLSEVKRIQSEMDQLARAAGFGDASAYYDELARIDPSQPYTDENRAEILAYSNALLARARERLPTAFNTLPIYRMEVLREPSFSEIPGGAAHAFSPSPDGVRPGRVYLHMLGRTAPRAGLPDLMCHEGVPGHVMQGDIRVRQTGVPQYRLAARNAAFNEGWGLYAELLCKEMGVYPDTPSDFRRLGAELYRAARLVADTGLHAKGWTEEEAIRYMIETGRRSPDEARSEVRRYLVNPGQATAYKIGMIRILQLRAEAARELGPRFDVKAFNDTVIGSGSLPLSVLDTVIRDWIKARK